MAAQILLSICILIVIAWVYYISQSQEKEEFKPEAENIVQLSHGITCYELCGPENAPLIVLMHGGTIPMCTWNEQVKKFTDAGFRILRYDQYGRGGSQRLSIPYTRKVFSDQLHDLLNSLKIHHPVHLLGPSFGGAISLSFASRFPQRVKSIVLISPAVNIFNSDSSLKFPIKICTYPIIGDFIFRTIVKKKVLKRGLELISDPSCRTTFQNQFFVKGTEKSLLSSFRTDAYGDYHEEISLTGKNVKNIFLIRGKKDKEVTEKMILQTKSDLPDCKFMELETAGHSPFSGEHGPEFTQMLIDFFNECERSSKSTIVQSVS
jgi:pimeloyl-ACP methyl ester carboxylesterase